MPSPTPLTEEQLALMTEQTRRAVHQTLRHWRIGATAGFVVLVLGVAGAFFANAHDQDASNRAIVRSGTLVAVDACNRDYRSREGDIKLFRRLIVAAGQSYKDGRITTEQYNAAVMFYQKEISKRPLPDCRKAIKTLTDDPGAERAPLKPLYPAQPDK